MKRKSYNKLLTISNAREQKDDDNIHVPIASRVQYIFYLFDDAEIILVGRHTSGIKPLAFQKTRCGDAST